jgi:hypothetical protein
MKKRPLTRKDKEILENTLITLFEEELEINKHKLALETFLTEQFIKFINKTYGNEFLENFKNSRECIKTTSTPSISSKSLYSLDSDYRAELINNVYDNKYCIGNLQGDSPDLKLSLFPIEFPIINLSLTVNFICPSLNRLDSNHQIFYKTSRNPLEIEDFIGPNEIEELIILFKEYYNRYFTITNSLRLYKYSGSSSTTFNYGEFLWNIKTWEDLEELDKDWFNILKEYIKTQESKKEFNISNLTMDEIFEGLDEELGL